MSTKLLPVALAALAVTAFSSVAAQADLYETRQVVVPYADLDISREPGANALLHRIESAADQACGSRPFILELKQQDAYVGCTGESVETAVIDVDAPMLTAAYERGGGRIGVVTVTEYDSGDRPAQSGSITMQPIPNP